MTRRSARRRVGVVEALGVVALSDRKALSFDLVREGGALRGQISHVALKPNGGTASPDHAQRITLGEPTTLRIIEALAGMGARLRESGR